MTDILKYNGLYQWIGNSEGSNLQNNIQVEQMHGFSKNENIQQKNELILYAK